MESALITDINELIYKTETDLWILETNLWRPKEKCGGGINQELGINIHTLLYVRQITNKDLLHSNRELDSIFCDNSYGEKV